MVTLCEWGDWVRALREKGVEETARPCRGRVNVNGKELRDKDLDNLDPTPNIRAIEPVVRAASPVSGRQGICSV
jgi:hypothetical protein